MAADPTQTRPGGSDHRRTLPPKKSFKGTVVIVTPSIKIQELADAWVEASSTPQAPSPRLTCFVSQEITSSLMREKPIVMPVLRNDGQKSVARKIHNSAPSMPGGTIVGVEVGERWMRARVERFEFAVLHLFAIAGR